MGPARWPRLRLILQSVPTVAVSRRRARRSAGPSWSSCPVGRPASSPCRSAATRPAGGRPTATRSTLRGSPSRSRASGRCAWSCTRRSAARAWSGSARRRATSCGRCRSTFRAFAVLSEAELGPELRSSVQVASLEVSGRDRTGRRLVEPVVTALGGPVDRRLVLSVRNLGAAPVAGVSISGAIGRDPRHRGAARRPADGHARSRRGADGAGGRPDADAGRRPLRRIRPGRLDGRGGDVRDVDRRATLGADGGRRADDRDHRSAAGFGRRRSGEDACQYCQRP